MVRSEDPPGTMKHLRFGKISPEICEALMKAPGVKSIVRHEGGAKGGAFKEHPHFHVWFESDTPITNQTVRNRLSKLPEFATHKGQNDWSFRNHDSYLKWCEYVCRNTTATLIKFEDELSKIYENEKLIDKSLPKDSTIQHIEGLQEVVKHVPKKSRAQREQLREHLIETWKWKVNGQFGIKNYTSAKLMCKSRIIDWYSGWLDDRDGIRMMRFLLYTFADDELRDELVFKISDSWDKYV